MQPHLIHIAGHSAFLLAHHVWFISHIVVCLHATSSHDEGKWRGEGCLVESFWKLRRWVVVSFLPPWHEWQSHEFACMPCWEAKFASCVADSMRLNAKPCRSCYVKPGNIPNVTLQWSRAAICSLGLPTCFQSDLERNTVSSIHCFFINILKSIY